MKKYVALLLCLALILTSGSACGRLGQENQQGQDASNGMEALHPGEDNDDGELVPYQGQENETEFDNLGDPNLRRFLEQAVYADLLDELDSSEYFVENVSTVYISREYLEELSYNSQENVYFGYTLAQLEEHFQGTEYIFTLNEYGETSVQAFVGVNSNYDEVMKNVAVGAGVLLVCVTVSVVAGVAGASAVSVIFAASAKTGTAVALSSGVFSAVTSGVVTGIQTQDFDEALEAAAVAGSEGFKWGAMSGVLFGGVKEAVALKGATLSGLTMNQAAAIQKESKYPLDVIKQFASVEQYEICKSAGLTPQVISGKTALIRKIDLNYVDDVGRTNLERMNQGMAALAPDGKAYELHHIGQKADSTLAVLTKAEHMQGGNNKIWHVFGEASEVHGAGSAWDAQRKAIWQGIAEFLASAN